MVIGDLKKVLSQLPDNMELAVYDEDTGAYWDMNTVSIIDTGKDTMVSLDCLVANIDPMNEYKYRGVNGAIVIYTEVE